MTSKGKKFHLEGRKLALGTIFNEVQRIMFNLDVRRQRLNEFSREAEEKALHYRRRIRNLIELNQLDQAKIETRNLVEANYDQLSLSVVSKKIGTVLAILREKLKVPGMVDSFLITFLKKADKAVRGNDLKEMDARLTKLKRHLQPEIIDEDAADIKMYLDSVRESEVNKLYNEIYDEVNIVQSLAGLAAKPIMDPIVRIPQFKSGPALKKKKKNEEFAPHHFELR